LNYLFLKYDLAVSVEKADSGCCKSAHFTSHMMSTLQLKMKGDIPILAKEKSREKRTQVFTRLIRIEKQ